MLDSVWVYHQIRQDQKKRRVNLFLQTFPRQDFVLSCESICLTETKVYIICSRFSVDLE